jgi:hypothetical protein
VWRQRLDRAEATSDERSLSVGSAKMDCIHCCRAGSVAEVVWPLYVVQQPFWLASVLALNSRFKAINVSVQGRIHCLRSLHICRSPMRLGSR